MRNAVLTFIITFILLISIRSNIINLPEGFHSDIDEVSVSAGHFHTCAIEFKPGIEFGGPIKCWGSNSRHQASPLVGIFAQISCGHLHSCAVAVNQTMVCWGNIKNVPSKGLFTQVSSGESHTCAILKDRSVRCWGRNDFGESTAPSGEFVQVSCGNSISCGIRPNGRVECWGKNNEGQSNAPKVTIFTQISASIFFHVCGITMNGDIECWGSNISGQSTFHQGPFIQVTTGARSTCAIREDESIVCWGRKLPITQEVMNRTIYDQITLGQDHLCAVDYDSQLHCWRTGANLGSDHVPLGFSVG